jgi:hypothetical protein
MITKSKDELVAKLTDAGFVFSQFQLVNEGDYAPYDADWNYKDIPHLNILHKQVNSYPTSIEEYVITSVNLQKVFGVPLPMVVVNYQSGPNRQTYYTSFLSLLLIVETTWETIGEIKTRVTTTYAIGSKGYLKFLHPIVRRLITRNYRNLMSEDIPMRTRRGDLRRWGYGFRTDGPPHSFTATLHILDENMVEKRELQPPASIHLDLDSLGQAAREDVLTTRSDHWGLRLRARDSQLLIFPRLCPHEGACLDTQAITDRSVRCPWHGRVLRPLVTLPFPWPADSAPIELRYHRLIPRADGLQVEFKDTPLAAQVDLHEQAADLHL